MAKAATSEARRKDAREKIELGGLIVKAGLRFEKRAVLLGALVELADRLQKEPGERARLLAVGDKAFGHEGD